MIISHYYLSLDLGIEKVMLDTDFIELTKMFMADGIKDMEIIQQLRNTGLSLALAAMTLKVAKEGIRTKEQCQVSKEVIYGTRCPLYVTK